MHTEEYQNLCVFIVKFSVGQYIVLLACFVDFQVKYVKLGTMYGFEKYFKYHRDYDEAIEF